MTDNRTTELLPCPICSKKVYIGLYGDGRDYWWMVHGGMHYDECKCRLFMESCKFELEDEAKVDYDERAMGIRGGLVRRWNTRAELGSGTLTAEQVMAIAGKHQPDYCSDTHVCFDWQAITDELNAELGSGTCENMEKRNASLLFVCSKCGAQIVNGTYSKEWMQQDHTDEECAEYDGETFNYCPNCGRAVKRG